jgi:hypothetical protein
VEKAMYKLITNSLVIFLTVTFSIPETTAQHSADRDESMIQVYTRNPLYWQYKGEPVLLLGGSVQDNLFQIDNLKEHLDLLVSVGGNYVRSTMSSRDPGNVKPFEMKNELFDLDEPGVEYWKRFKTFLDLAVERDIIVQVEIWATYDFYWGERSWAENPFNPRLNSSYTTGESKLPEIIDYPAQTKNNPFFRTVPELDNNRVVLEYQQKFVDKLMSIALEYPNVLYCIDNETKARPEWGRYWSAYIRDIAEKAGRKIYVTEMWDTWDPSDGLVPRAVSQHSSLGPWYSEHLNLELSSWAKPRNTINDPESYQFVDISNNNAQRGEVHYNTSLFVRNLVLFSRYARPVNNVKIYGGMMNTIGQENIFWAAFHKDGEERFWRNIFAGHASARFHRPDWGLGLNHVAQHHIKSMRMLTDSLDFFRMKPATHLLGDREENEAFCISVDGKQYAIYFTGKGKVTLNVPPGNYEVNWLQIRSSHWGEPTTMELPGKLKTPSDDQWAVLITYISN